MKKSKKYKTPKITSRKVEYNFFFQNSSNDFDLLAGRLLAGTGCRCDSHPGFCIPCESGTDGCC